MSTHTCGARHHRWLTAAALVAEVMPVVPLLREAPARVGGSSRWTRTSARRTITSRGCWPAHWSPSPRRVVTPRRSRAAPHRSSAGLRGVAATGAGAEALARVHRILRPPDRLPRQRAALTRAAVVALTVAPLVLATAPAVVALLP